jgi:hypothetical protein
MIPDAAIEAAAETLDAIGSVAPNMTPRYVAQLAVQAAMPAIRKALAAEIVSDGPKYPYNEDERVRINAWCAGLHEAARIVRGGAQ